LVNEIPAQAEKEKDMIMGKDDKSVFSTETGEFRQFLVDRVELLHQKRTNDRITLYCVIIGAIGVILTGVWFVLNLKLQPLEKKVERIEMRLDVMETKIKRDDELCFMMDERGELIIKTHEARYHNGKN